MKARHHKLIADHESLQRDYFALLDQQAALKRDVENLLAQHQKLVQAVKVPSRPTPWFEGASVALTQLAVDPDQRAIDVMTAALASLLQRLSTIKLRGNAL
jgi:hypothetical protein